MDKVDSSHLLMLLGKISLAYFMSNKIVFISHGVACIQSHHLLRKDEGKGERGKKLAPFLTSSLCFRRLGVNKSLISYLKL